MRIPRSLLVLLGSSVLLAPRAGMAASILLYEDNARGYAGDALDLLGLSYTTSSSSNFTTLVNTGAYDLIVIDMPSNLPSGSWQSAIASHISRGDMAIMGFWRFEGEPTLKSAFQTNTTTDLSTPQSFYRWSSSHPVFNTPYATPDPMVWTSDAWADDGDYLQPTSGGTAIAGYSSSSSSSTGAIVVGNSDRTIYNGFVFDSYQGDYDGDGIRDITELIANEVTYLLGGACDQDGDGFDDSGSCGGADCDDTDAAIYPGATETPYDGVDDDCDGSDLTDVDGDGYDSDTVTGGTDCADGDASVYPGAPETADGVDEDCDGDVDEETSWYDDDGDGWTEDGGDCDDADASISPGSAETIDGVDEDCDGLVDEGTSVYDDDGDGFAEADGDCNDDDAAVYPGATEINGNGVDDDCDGVIDDGAFDADGDGVMAWAGDCDDTNPDVFPGAEETADGVDEDCDGLIDEGTSAYDDDGDGYSEDEGDCHDGDVAIGPDAEEVPDNGVDDDCDGDVDEGSDSFDDDGDGYSEDAGDCDDSTSEVSPGASELPGNDVDDDCDGEVDETSGDDLDADGFTAADGDCDDTDGWVFPGAPEMCDGVDNDCNGVADDGCTSAEAESEVKVPEGCASAVPDRPWPPWLVLVGLWGVLLRRRPDSAS